MARKYELITDENHIYFEPRTLAQERAMETIKEHDLTFLLGPAGSAKTFTAIAASMLEMQMHNTGKRKQVQKVYITRPIVEAGEKLGSLPGEVSEKVHPYMIPIYACVDKLVQNSAKFIKDNFVISPLAYLRGYTFEHSIAILDEAQNCTIGQLLLFMSRLGFGSKMVIAGDTDQSDIGRYSGLYPWVNSLRGKNGIAFVEFTEQDIVRHPLVKVILANKPKQ